VTQKNGAKVKKRVEIGNPIPAGDPEKRNKKTPGEIALYKSGITLYHKYTLKEEFRRDVKQIGDKLENAQEISVAVPGSAGTVFTGTQYKTLVARYIKPYDRTKNELTVYQLYPIEAFDVIYPANEGGVEPYLQANSGGTYTRHKQDATITISTNVKFTVTVQSDGDWLSVVGGPEFDSTVTSITLHLDENNTGSARTGTTILHCTEPGVSTSDVPDIRIDIIQIEDEVAPVAEAAADAQQAADDAQRAADEANRKIDELDPDNGGGN
jgi:hypothetical protein